MSKEELPQYTDEDYLGDKGVRMVDEVVSEQLQWIFRDLRKADLGIDAQIELVTPEKQGTGRLIGAQIKCGKSFFSEENEIGYVFRGKSKHLKYWLEHSLPVLIVICDPENSNCYWQEVSSANTIKLEKGWKITIPRTNVLSSNSKSSLTDIAGKPQHADIVKALLYEFLHEKYCRQIEICTIFELPRDYYKFLHLAEINNELVMIDLHYDQYGKVRVEDLKEIIRWKKYNSEQCGAKKLHIYIASESSSALQLSSEVTEYLDAYESVSVFTILYERSNMHWLSEEGQYGSKEEFYPEFG